VPPDEGCCVLGRFFVFNYKIMIKVQESPPSIMVTRNLWFARVWVRDWLCKGKGLNCKKIEVLGSIREKAKLVDSVLQLNP
jgi:hypothetical protein